MTMFGKFGLVAMGAAALAMATPAAAQLTVYEDYTPSDEVVEMTFVKVDEGQFDTYLEGLKGTWVEANKVQKQMGHITDYKIYGVPYGDNSVNMVLTITYPNTAMVGPSRERYMAFMSAWGEANIDQSNKTVLELYNKIRKIQGTYMLREVVMDD